ncbi:unnamed protein product [Caenorhabditis brenneri]
MTTCPRNSTDDEADFYSPDLDRQDDNTEDDFDVVMSDDSGDSSFSEPPPVLEVESYNDETMLTMSSGDEESSSNAGASSWSVINSDVESLVEIRSVSPSSDACSTSSSSYQQRTVNSPANSTASSLAGGSSHHGSSGSTRPVALTRERKSYAAAAGRQAPMRSLSPAHPNAVMSGMDDLLRPERFDRIMHMPPPAQYIQEQHSWNPEDRSLNIFVKDEDKFTFHRHPVAQSTDCIRGKLGYSRGFHVWQIEWPERQRGTHAVVGVATKTAPLHATGYTALIGTTNESYGWDITRRECHHDSKNTMTWRYPFGNSRDVYHVPDKFYCILDMDEGYMAFATDEEYLGVAFRNLKGKTLFPIVAAVWGHCEISMRYLGSLEPEPLSLSELCRRRVRIQIGHQPEERIEELPIPPILKRYLMYQY